MFLTMNQYHINYAAIFFSPVVWYLQFHFWLCWPYIHPLVPCQNHLPSPTNWIELLFCNQNIIRIVKSSKLNNHVLTNLMNRFLLSRGVSIQLRLRSVTDIGDSDDLPLPIVRLCIFNFAVELILKPRYVVLSGDVGSLHRRFRTVAGRRVHLIGICGMRNMMMENRNYRNITSELNYL